MLAAGDIERLRAATARIRAHHSLDDVLAVAQEEAGELVTEIARLRRSGRATHDSVCREAIDCLTVCLSLLDALSVSRLTVAAKVEQVETYAETTEERARRAR